MLRRLIGWWLDCLDWAMNTLRPGRVPFLPADPRGQLAVRFHSAELLACDCGCGGLLTRITLERPGGGRVVLLMYGSVGKLHRALGLVLDKAAEMADAN